MSLAVLADHMASKGRGPDTMLVHMAPEEVRGLQALAVSHGGSLTINPETGLPEAGILSKLLPTIIGFGISYLSGGTIDPMTAGMIVGGVETARTGDIGKGISAGLGAYGGAGLGAGLMTTGTGALSAEVGGEALKTAGLTGEAALTAEADQVAQRAIGEKLATATPYETLSAGAGKVVSSPEAMGQFAKTNAKNLMYAAGPAVLAGANVESKLPQTVTKPGMIRPYSYDPYGGTYAAGVPYEATARAAGGGLMGMADGGYNPGMLDFAQRSEPVVRMASGGIAHFADGGYTPEQRYGSINDFLRTNPSAEALAAAQAQFQVTPEELAAAKNYGYQRYESINNFLGTNPSAEALTSAQQQYGVNNTELAAARQYANVGAPPGTPGVDSSKVVVGGGGYDNYQMPGFTGDNNRVYTPEQRLGINEAFIRSQEDANYGIAGLMADMEKTGVTAKDLALSRGLDQNTVNQYLIRGGANLDFMGIGKGMDIAKQDEFIKWQNSQPNPYGQGTLGDMYKAQGLSDDSPIRRAQAQEQIEREERRNLMRTNAGAEPIPGSGGGGGGSGGGGSGGGGSGGGGSGGGGSGPGPGGSGGGGSGSGGYTGMGDLRDRYTAGGGSLGYTPYVPTSMADFNAKYNTQTGGSAQKFDELTGKTAYSPTPYTPTGELMKPYYESVGRMPVNMKTKKYIFKDGKYVLNPEYVKPSYVLAAEKNTALTTQDTKPTFDPGAGNEWVWSTTDKKWEAKPVAGSSGPVVTPGDTGANGGMVRRMALGGLGALAGGGSASQYNLGGYSDGGRLLRGPGDGVSDSIPATIGNKRPARLADGEFVVPARIVSELGNGSTEAGARKLYAMMDRVQKARGSTTGKGRVAKNSRADKYLPA